MSLDERFVRWQKQAVKQLSTAINLFSGLSVAALGFSVVFIRENSFTPSKCYAVLYLLSIALFGVSTVCGAAASITRLLDLRATARRVRLRKTDPASPEIDYAGDEAKGLGKATWRLFWWAIGTFFCGVWALAISLFSVFGAAFLQKVGL